MKAKYLSLLVAAGLLAGSVASASSPFNGFGVGLNLGWTYNKYNLKVEDTSINASGTKNLLPLGAHINWLYSQPDSFLFGLEAGFDYDFGSGEKLKHEDFPNNSYVEIKKGFTTMLTPKIGWNFQDCWSLYALLGFGGTNFKTKAVVGNDSAKGSNFHFAIAPGVGAEVAVDCFRIGFEYKYVYYNTRGEKLKFSDGTETSKLNLDPCAHDFRVRATLALG